MFWIMDFRQLKVIENTQQYMFFEYVFEELHEDNFTAGQHVPIMSPYEKRVKELKK